MGKLWFDGSSAPDGETPPWVGVPPEGVVATALGSRLHIVDNRSLTGFWNSGILSDAAEVDVVVRWRKNTPGSHSYTNAGISVRLHKDSLNSAIAGFGSGSVYHSAHARRYINSSTSTDVGINNVFPTSREINVWRMCRVQYTAGGVFRFRGWDETEQEPSTWDYSVAFSIALVETRVMFPYVIGHATEIDYIAIGTGGDAAPTKTEYSVSGLVVDPAGNPAGRAVRLLHRGSGKLLAQGQSDPTTGFYSLPTPYGGTECNVICLDDGDPPTYNDLILRTTPA